MRWQLYAEPEQGRKVTGLCPLLQIPDVSL